MSFSYPGRPTTPTSKRIENHEGSTQISLPSSYRPITPRRRQKASLFMPPPSRKHASAPYPSPSSRPNSKNLNEAVECRKGRDVTSIARMRIPSDSVNADNPGGSTSPSCTHSLQPLRSSYAESEIISPTTNLPLDRTFNPTVERASTRILGYAEMQLLQGSTPRAPQSAKKRLVGTMKGLTKLEAGILKARKTTRKNKAL